MSTESTLGSQRPDSPGPPHGRARFGERCASLDAGGRSARGGRLVISRASAWREAKTVGNPTSSSTRTRPRQFFARSATIPCRSSQADAESSSRALATLRDRARAQRKMTVKAILFDLDNTLVPEMPTYAAAFADAMARVPEVGDLNVDALRGAVFEASADLWLASPLADYCLRLGLGSPTSLLSDFPGRSPELAHLRAWAPEYRREAWTRGLTSLGLVNAGSLPERLDRSFREALRARCTPYEDVLVALNDLSPTYRLAVVTNGPLDVQTTKLRASGLERFFPLVVASSEVGCGKPDPAVFRVAVRAMSLAPSDVVVIGDSVDRDIAGARAASLRSVWLDRAMTARDSDVPVIRSLSELRPLLSGWNE